MLLIAEQIGWAVSQERREQHLRNILLANADFRSIGKVMQPLHDASHTTVMLRAGLSLGIIKPQGNA